MAVNSLSDSRVKKITREREYANSVTSLGSRAHFVIKVGPYRPIVLAYEAVCSAGPLDMMVFVEFLLPSSLQQDPTNPWAIVYGRIELFHVSTQPGMYATNRILYSWSSFCSPNS